MASEREPLDRLIVERQILRAVRWLMSTFECGLQEAAQVLYARYDDLRRSRPDDFTTSHEECWEGVYT
ncbi:hypothetical protein [Spirillospora albida]|uniref:hypothetical protein n=1 Tax=Spirillospora albida TaxID=58123 RepID=UPI0004C25139|nr:hypothetical protein [Spirillospora albida]